MSWRQVILLCLTALIVEKVHCVPNTDPFGNFDETQFYHDKLSDKNLPLPGINHEVHQVDLGSYALNALNHPVHGWLNWFFHWPASAIWFRNSSSGIYYMRVFYSPTTYYIYPTTVTHVDFSKSGSYKSAAQLDSTSLKSDADVLEHNFNEIGAMWMPVGLPSRHFKEMKDGGYFKKDGKMPGMLGVLDRGIDGRWMRHDNSDQVHHQNLDDTIHVFVRRIPQK